MSCIASINTSDLLEEVCPTKLKGFMKASLARCNQLLAHDALRPLRLALGDGLVTSPEAVEQLIRRALRLQCPEDLQARPVVGLAVPQEALVLRPGDVEAFMRRVVTELLPCWLRQPWALEAKEFRLRLARECFERSGQRDVEGVLEALECIYKIVFSQQQNALGYNLSMQGVGMLQLTGRGWKIF